MDMEDEVSIGRPSSIQLQALRAKVVTWTYLQFNEFEKEINRSSVTDEGAEETEHDAESLEYKICFWRPTCFDGSHVTHLILDRIFSLETPDVQIRRSLRLVCELVNVEVLSLKSNNLREKHLPLQMCKSRHLTSLDISCNAISHLSQLLIFNCTRLKVLSVTDNRLSCLPACLLNLPSLEAIHRLRNRGYNDGYIEFQNVLPQRRRKVDLSTTSTLAVLSMRTAITSGKINSLRYMPPLITQLMEETSFDLYVCDNCSKGINDVDYRFPLYPSKFLGLTYLPLEAHTCSEQCSEELFEKWDYQSTKTVIQ